MEMAKFVPAMIITLTGFMGSGKTTVGEILARKLGYEFFDLDRYLEHKWCGTIPELFSRGELWFRAAEAEALRDLIIMSQVAGTDRVIALGGGTFSNPVLRSLILESTVSVFLSVPLDVALSRTGSAAEARPMLGLYDAESLYNSRLADYSLASLTVDATASPAAVADSIASSL